MSRKLSSLDWAGIHCHSGQSLKNRETARNQSSVLGVVHGVETCLKRPSSAAQPLALTLLVLQVILGRGSNTSFSDLSKPAMSRSPVPKGICGEKAHHVA